MPKLNQKQNLLRMIDGQMPEYVPINSMMDRSKPPLFAGGMMFNPGILGDFRGPNGGYDPWGVHYTVESSAGVVASIPEPGNFILKDVTKWEEVIKAPAYFKDWDWERASKEELAKIPYDPEMSIFVAKGWDDFFQQFIGMMGFTEGLCALYDEPEAVHALLDFMCDTVIDITKNVLYYYKPEAYYLLDDSAAKLTPFVGREMFEEFFVPRYKRTLDLVRDAGIPVLYHNCGRCEDLLPPMVRLGVKIWDPAQVENDLTEVKNRFGRQLIINGGFEFKPRDIEAVTEEEAREAVRDHFNRLAPNGGWIFGGMVQSLDFMNPKVQQINAWIKDEAEKLSVEFYKH